MSSRRGRRTWSKEEVADFLQGYGFELLSDNYGGSGATIEYLCRCGAQNKGIFRALKYALLNHPRRGCRSCRTTNAVATNKRNHGGALYVQSEEFKRRRVETNRTRYGVDNPLQSAAMQEKRRRTCIERYGVDAVSKVPAIVQRQREGFLRKHGVSHHMLVPEMKEKTKRTWLERYGVPSLAHLSRCASKESQNLFRAIMERLPEDMHEKTYFAQKNREFTVQYKGDFFKYDFVQSQTKRVVEYNGWNFHPRPDQDEHEVGWCAFHPDLSVRDARLREEKKHRAIEERSFVILVVWDRDYRRDPEAVIARCVEFVRSASPLS